MLKGLKAWWKRCWEGGYWSQSKLNSRKFLLATLCYAGFLGLAYVAVLVFGVIEAPIFDTAVNAVRDIVIGYFTVNVVEAGVNVWANGKKNGTNGQQNGI